MNKIIIMIICCLFLFGCNTYKNIDDAEKNIDDTEHIWIGDNGVEFKE